MKKIKKGVRLDASLIKNPVAKFAHQFNRSQAFKDKTKYQRNAKHKGKEPFPMMLSVVLEKVSVRLILQRAATRDCPYLLFNCSIAQSCSQPAQQIFSDHRF
jgi:stalled ribosome alternative rescue factor ArfA